MRLLKLLRGVAELIPVIGNILAIIGKKKAEAKYQKIEQAAASIIKGVEWYQNRIGPGPDNNLKEIIKGKALADKTEPLLNTLVRKYTD